MFQYDKTTLCSGLNLSPLRKAQLDPGVNRPAHEQLSFVKVKEAQVPRFPDYKFTHSRNRQHSLQIFLIQSLLLFYNGTTWFKAKPSVLVGVKWKQRWQCDKTLWHLLHTANRKVPSRLAVHSQPGPSLKRWRGSPGVPVNTLACLSPWGFILEVLK